MNELYQRGNAELLQRRRLGLIASRNVREDLTDSVVDTVLRLSRSEAVVLMSGWHAPIEQQVHAAIVHGTVPHIHAGAKSLEKLTCELDQGNLFFLTHCSPGVTRVSRATALRRNRLICELSSALIIPWLNPDGKTHHIVKEWCGSKPVYVFDSLYNRELIRAGAMEISTLTTG